MVFEALPRAGWEGSGGSDTLRGQIRERGIVGLAVVHEDGALPADPEVLVGALRAIRLGDERYVIRRKCLGGFPGRKLTCQHHNLLTSLTVLQAFIDPISAEGMYLQPSSNVDITGRDLGRSEKDVPAVTPSTVNPDRVLPAVRGRSVKAHVAPLVAVWRVNRPCCLIPSALEVVGDLGQGGREKRESDKTDLTEHCRSCISVDNTQECMWSLKKKTRTSQAEKAKIFVCSSSTERMPPLRLWRDRDGSTDI